MKRLLHKKGHTGKVGPGTSAGGTPGPRNVLVGPWIRDPQGGTRESGHQSI